MMAEKGATNKYSVHLIDRIQQKCAFLIGAKNLKILYEKMVILHLYWIRKLHFLNFDCVMLT